MADPSQKFGIKPILQINDESWRKFKINDYLGRGRGGGCLTFRAPVLLLEE
jgi:hypothetical protein